MSEGWGGVVKGERKREGGKCGEGKRGEMGGRGGGAGRGSGGS